MASSSAISGGGDGDGSTGTDGFEVAFGIVLSFVCLGAGCFVSGLVEVSGVLDLVDVSGVLDLFGLSDCDFGYSFTFTTK